MRESEQARREHDAARYARGELRGAEAAAFERRLGEDQAARDALCEAVRWAAVSDGREPPRPDPAYRRCVLRRLRPRRPGVAGRGRAAAWALAGAAAAAAVFFFLLPTPPRPPAVGGAGPAPPAASAPAVAGETPPAPPAGGPAVVGAGDARPDVAKGDAPDRTRPDEDRHLVRGDETPSPLQPPPPMKH